MSLIMKIQQLQGPAIQQMQLLYQQNRFPLEVRYYCAPWIEAQQWGNIDVDSPSSEPAATILLQQLVQQINQKAEALTGEDKFFLRMKLSNFATELYETYGNDSLKFVRVVRHCLEKEQRLVDQDTNGLQDSLEQVMPVSDAHNEIESTLQNLKYKTQAQEKFLGDMQQKQELFAVQLQERRCMLENTLASLQQQYPQQDDPNRRAEFARFSQKKLELNSLVQNEAQQLMGLRMQLAKMHQETFMMLSNVQSKVLGDELKIWKRQQQLAGIGGSPEGSLDVLQSWCEALAEVTWQNRQQLQRIEMLKQQVPMNAPAQDVPDLSNNFTGLLSALVSSTFVIEKQPPQVLKKETRFSAAIRLLVGGKLNVHMNPPQVKATIISEAQAKDMLHNESANFNETSGDIINNSGVLEYHKDSGVLNVTFRNMSLKKIRRADRRGQEFVTEEKFTLLFRSNFSVASGELMFQVRTMSLPVVVIVHGNQEANALATVLWDYAFAEPGRIPFAVPDKVPWPEMAQALNSKFMAVNGRSLSNENMQYLAMKAFSGQNVQTDDYNSMYISWSTFNRDPLPGCTFTFWKWFHGVLELTRKYLRAPWNEGSILGFITKEHAQELLLTKQTGTFLLRFSDSKLGAISITWVNEDPTTGDRQVLNLLPFSSEDFHIRSLADRIHDLPHLTNLFPDIPKDTAFGNFYTPMDEVLPQAGDGYVSSVLVSKIPQLSAPPSYPIENPGSVEPASPQQQPHNSRQEFVDFGGISDFDDMLEDREQEETQLAPDINELLKDFDTFDMDPIL
ncbi:signal transducer and activator of transcription 5A-like isoform X2 [Acanthaster planci]|uniref:Signal transducer and activator of transcription n=1 Tax=Acanthaster planci TaxID=133434 RepID=A0A8B7Y0G5_ACAPL|nr:signal transducer and activator of transcription 5A-like isoform X2 [Acanthaster planci]